MGRRAPARATGAPAPGLALAEWYAAHGRHDLVWRATRDRWAVLVSEVMLHQTQVARVLVAFPPFMARFPTPQAAADAGVGEVIRAWGRLGYPRRARRLWEAAVVVSEHGWPEQLTDLPGVGRYTAGAVLAQCDDVDVPAADVNIRRVVERFGGTALGPVAAERALVELAAPLTGRDRLLAVMDLGATVCVARAPRCDGCPVHRWCATRGVRPGEGRTAAAPFEGSFRQRRGRVMAALRAAGPHATATGGTTAGARDPAGAGDTGVPVAGLDAEALASLVADGLAVVDGDAARLP